MKMTRLAAYLLFLSVAYHPAIAAAQDGDVNKRYPWRVPEWLWDTDATAHLLTTEEVVSLRYDIAKLAALEKLPTSSAADALEEDIVKLLSSKFSSRDLAAGATLVKGEHSGIVMAVQIDPSFDPVAKNTIQQAISQLIDVILDPAVIKKAFELSTTTPSPMPEMFEGGKKKTDPLGRPIFTSAYAEYLKYRAGPTNPEQFSTHLRNALTDFSGDPTLLVISRYTGNVWWGGAWHRFFINPIQQLSRNSPSRGYFYIRL